MISPCISYWLRWSEGYRAVIFANHLIDEDLDAREVDHLVPLSDLKLDLLERMERVSGEEEFIFPSRNGGGGLKAP